MNRKKQGEVFIFTKHSISYTKMGKQKIANLIMMEEGYIYQSVKILKLKILK